MRSCVFFLSFVWLFSGVCLSADPHPHNGVLAPYDGEPPDIPLTLGERKTLDTGTPVYKTIKMEEGGRAVAVFRVNTPADAVWSVISDFASYPQWIDSLKEAEVYRRDGDNILVRFRIQKFPVNITYYVNHNYPMAKKPRGAWDLDYSIKSHVHDSVGFWKVVPLKEDSNRCDVYYSVQIKLSGWIPGFIKDYLVDKGIKEATSWVKIQAEKRHAGN